MIPPTLLLYFFSAIVLSSLAIIGFYRATRFEWGKDDLEFRYTIKSGAIQVVSDATPIKTIMKEGHFDEIQYTAELKIAKNSQLSINGMSPESEFTISYITRKEVIEEDSKEILWRVKYYANKWLGEYWSKPICDCIICMSSVHSIWVWFPIYYLTPFTWWLIYAQIGFVFVLAGINNLIANNWEI